MKVKLFSKFWTFFYLMICLMSLSDYQAFAQERFSVSGVVKDQLNEPIMGASIVSSKGTVKGTITDLDGNFEYLNQRPLTFFGDLRIHITLKDLEYQ